MKQNILELKKLFEKIKNTELNESLRKGTTGIGYTFESLIGKDEDSNYLPDFNGIEIKTKLGYTKSPMTLFTLVPTKYNENAIHYILNNYGYPAKNPDFKSFRGDVFCQKNNIIANRYIFKTIINAAENKLQLLIYNKDFQLIDDSIFWNLDRIEERLFKKLEYLAIIKGYPYKRYGKTYYKYTNLSIYKLKNFETFLRLLNEDKIFLVFNIGFHTSTERYGQINDRGTAFRLQLSSIEELFDKID